MGSGGPSAPTVDDGSMLADAPISGSCPSRKNQKKVPKRIHKAEREKMKRDHLNELFISLANALELTDQNSGKASILREATRIAKETLGQIDSLKRENAALMSESQYVTIEKNELKDENASLEVQIGKLKSELNERLSQSKVDVAQESQQSALASQFWEDSIGPHTVETAVHRAPNMNPFFIVPFHSDFHVLPDSDATTDVAAPKPIISHVSKPQARYPTPADSWPSQLLERWPESGR